MTALPVEDPDTGCPRCAGTLYPDDGDLTCWNCGGTVYRYRPLPRTRQIERSLHMIDGYPPSPELEEP